MFMVVVKCALALFASLCGTQVAKVNPCAGVQNASKDMFRV